MEPIPDLPLPPRQAEFQLVAGFGERPLLPCIIDPFGKGSDLPSHGSIKLTGALPVTPVLKTLPARESSLL